MINIEGEQVRMIDADAHVIENESTWSFLDPSEERFRPRLVESETDTRGVKLPGQQCWVLDGKIIGFRPTTRTPQELEELTEQTGRDPFIPATHGKVPTRHRLSKLKLFHRA